MSNMTKVLIGLAVCFFLLVFSSVMYWFGENGPEREFSPGPASPAARATQLPAASSATPVPETTP